LVEKKAGILKSNVYATTEQIKREKCEKYWNKHIILLAVSIPFNRDGSRQFLRSGLQL